MPASFVELARRSANEAGFPAFVTGQLSHQSLYPGAKLSMHQDKDERDFTAPIVSALSAFLQYFCLGEIGVQIRLYALQLFTGMYWCGWPGTTTLPRSIAVEKTVFIHSLAGTALT